MDAARKLAFRIGWWRGCWAYDRSFDVKGNRDSWPYLLRFTRPRYSCRHRTRLLRLPCLRATTYDGWCGFHNSRCHLRHDPDVNRCDGRTPA